MNLGGASMQMLYLEGSQNGSREVGGVYMMPPIDPNDEHPCTTCNGLDASIIHNDSASTNLGSMAEIKARASRCPACRSIVLLCPVQGAHDDNLEITVNYEQRQPRLHLKYRDMAREEHTPEEARAIVNGIMQVDMSPRSVAFREVERTNPNEGSGQAFRPDSIDIGLLQSWLDRCTMSHGPPCNERLHHVVNARLPKYPRLSFVDLTEECVATPDVSVPYVALSYVWGGIETCKAMSTNLARLCQPGSLSEDSEFQIAKTIRDAMKLAQSLGVRYLWVDSLSIIQDGPNIQAHLNAMGQIYHDATYTIVIANGSSANTGISGVGGQRGLRKEEHVLCFPQSTFTLDAVSPAIDLHISDWAWRGWTYQEYLFSRRTLILNRQHGLAGWICQNAHWSEEICLPIRDDQVLGRGPRLVLDSINSIPAWPDLISYGGIVSSFTTKILSFEDDVISAFQGISSIMESSFRCQFIYGLPCAFFDLALLWTPSNGVRRRVGARGSSFPSWSWMGWVGRISYGALEDSAREWIYDGMPMLTTNIVTWLLVDVPPEFTGFRNEQVQHFQGLFIHDKEVLASLGISRNPSVALPGSRWIRHQDRVHLGNYYFTHPSAPGGKFRYPTSSLFDYDLRHTQRPKWRHIFARVEKAALFITNVQPCQQDYVPVPNQQPFRTSSADLTSDSDELVGNISIDLPDSQQLPARQPCTIIAISRSFVMHDANANPAPDYPELRNNNEQSVGRFYHFYNVLWIEWEDGIAYRKALGRVTRAFWESQLRETIRIVLG